MPLISYFKLKNKSGLSGSIKLPSLVIYKNGVRIDILAGAMNMNDLENYIVKNGGYFSFLFKAVIKKIYF